MDKLGFCVLLCLSLFFLESIAISMPSHVSKLILGRENAQTHNIIQLNMNSGDDNLNDNQSSIYQAQELKRKAKELLAEARAMEAQLLYSRSNKVGKLTQEQDKLIKILFERNDYGNETVTKLAKKLREERWSPEKLLPIVERLHQRLCRSMGRAPFSATRGTFQIGDTRQATREEDDDEMMRLSFYIADLIAAANQLDEETARGIGSNNRWNGRVATMLEAKVRELQRSGAVKKSDHENSDPIKRYVEQSIPTNDPQSINLKFMTDIPEWLPPTFAEYLNENNKTLFKCNMDPDEIAMIKKDVLQGSRFLCSTVESNKMGAFFGGTLRSEVGNSSRDYSGAVFDEIQERMKQSGLSKNIQLFFIRDPRGILRGHEEQLGVLALPKSVLPQLPKNHKATATIAYATALASTFGYAVSSFALNPTFFASIMNQRNIDPVVLIPCASVLLGVLGIQLLHEVAHRTVASRMKMEIGLPVPLLSPELGLFGAVTPFLSFPPDRRAVFDFSISGPLAGMVASIGCIVGGLIATLSATTNMLAKFPVVPVGLFKCSLLTGSILSLLAPKVMLLPNAQPIPIHPAFCIGFAGLLTNALNMLPMLGLDGGYALLAIIGRTRASLATMGTIITLAMAYLQADYSSLFPTFGIIFALSRLGQKPFLVRNEITPVDDNRVAVYFVVFTLALVALIPFPGGQGVF